MNHTIDFLRLAGSDPLVLKVSALTDFLWPEFVRDAKPQVKYFADQFEIRQLSRFGKELFEFFYCGGEATPVVSLDDIEDYFRAKQDGLNPDAPKGFKPEYTLWSKILIDVANSPAYPAFQENCLGKHFESGNAAVCVLNELSDVLNEMLEENAQVHAALTSMAEELQGLRESFVEAMKAGDTTRAAELRQRGKELGESIEDILNNVHSTNKSEIDKSIEQAQKDSDSTSSALNCLAGDNEGFGVKLENVNEKQELASRLKKNKKLMDFARRLGAMKQAWNQRKRAKKHTSTYSDIVGANMSDDVTKAFPTELALAASKKGRALFALKHSQKTILTKDFEARSKELVQGPVVLYVDISGSMCGENELWSKAMAYQINHYKIEHFRFHSSGDIQSYQHALNIIEVARLCPDTKFWIPTREMKIMGDLKKNEVDIPENCVFRLSAPMVNGKLNTNIFSNTSSVVDTEKFFGNSWRCPALDQGGSCLECRACWDKDVKDVAYTKH